jgi:hypothetical protein
MEENQEIQWIASEERRGCGIACCAMLTGQSYIQTRSWFGDRTGEGGICYWEIDNFLGRHGYAVIRKMQSDIHMDHWPQKPFAKSHYCVVYLVDGSSHFVVMLEDGTVLDPDDSKPKHLSAWSSIESVTGVFFVCERR